MLTVLAALIFLLANFILPGPFARVVGAKFATMLLATTGVLVFPVFLGLTWRAVLAGGCDVILLFMGATLASRVAFPRELCLVWLKRLAAAISAVLFVFFAALALMVSSLADQAIDALPYDFLAVISGTAFTLLLWSRQAFWGTKMEPADAVGDEPCAG